MVRKHKVVIATSTKCFHRCCYCTAHYLQQVKGKIMPLDKFDRLVRILKREGYGTIIPYHIGELILHPQYEEILCCVAGHQMPCSIHSRLGIKMGKDKWERIFNAFGEAKKSLSIEVTIDGLPGDVETTAVNLDYSVQWKNIEMIASVINGMNKRFGKMILTTLVTSLNEYRLDLIEDRAKGLGVIWRARPFGRINQYEKPEHLEMINKLAPKGAKWRKLLKVDKDGNVRNRSVPCRDAGVIAVIGLEGEVLICCMDSLHETGCGNVFEEDSVDKVIESDQYKENLRKAHKKLFNCCHNKC